MPADDDSTFVTVARILKTQGRHGELAAELHTDFPERFTQLKSVFLKIGERRREFGLRHHWFHKGMVVLSLADVDDINTAEVWIGAEVQVPRRERVEAGEGVYFISDLNGCDVFDRGARLGVLRAVEIVPGSVPLFHIDAQGGEEILVPFAREYVRNVNVGARRIEMELPEGLVELNRKE